MNKGQGNKTEYEGHWLHWMTKVEAFQFTFRNASQDEWDEGEFVEFVSKYLFGLSVPPLEMMIRRCYKKCALLIAMMFHWSMLIRLLKHIVLLISSVPCWQRDRRLCLFMTEYSLIKWLLPCHSTELRNLRVETACYLWCIVMMIQGKFAIYGILILLIVLTACAFWVNILWLQVQLFLTI